MLQADAAGAEGRRITGSYRQCNAAAASHCQVAGRGSHTLQPTAHSAVDAMYEQPSACCQARSHGDLCRNCQALAPSPGELLSSCQTELVASAVEKLIVTHFYRVQLPSCCNLFHAWQGLPLQLPRLRSLTLNLCVVTGYAVSLPTG